MSVVACVVPAFNEEEFIESVLGGIPDFVKHIIVVNDGSTDDTEGVVKEISDPRVDLINHSSNQGVGSAVVSGYQRALKLGAEIVVKVDADGQMDSAEIRRLIAPIERGEADYCKGVRFRDAEVIKKMPAVRLIGNLGLSFLTKMASGYWDIFDPTNGFTAIERTALQELELEGISRGFFFESDMLCSLYLLDAVVVDVPTKTRYGAEKSHLNPMKVLFSFPFHLLRGACKRIFFRYFIRDFTAFSAFLLAGVSLLALGSLYGSYNWIRAWMSGTPAATGVVMLAVLSLILGFQLLLQAAVLDIHNVPRRPLRQRFGGAADDVNNR